MNQQSPRVKQKTDRKAARCQVATIDNVIITQSNEIACFYILSCSMSH